MSIKHLQSTPSTPNDTIESIAKHYINVRFLPIDLLILFIDRGLSE